MSTGPARTIAISVTPEGEVQLAGLPVFVGSDDDLLDRIDLCRASGVPSLVVTANVDQAVDLTRSRELQAAYTDASIRTLDGMPLVWLAKMAGARGANRQTGADLLDKCVAASETRGWRIAILGGAPEVNDSAVVKLRKKFPQAKIFGVDVPFSPGFDTEETAVVVERLANVRPDVVFICLGSPKQEQFYMELRGELHPAVYIGSGAAVDFAAGVRRRAPHFIQQLGLEWTWRLAQEPRRLARRYLVKGIGLGRIVFNSIERKQL